MHRRRVPLLIRAVILCLASLPLARAAATSSAEAAGLGGAHVHEARIAGRGGLIVPAGLAAGAALVAMTNAVEERPAANVPSQRQIAQPPAVQRAVAVVAAAHAASAQTQMAGPLAAREAPGLRDLGLPTLTSLAPFPFKARSLTGALTARAP
jgi:hypothetical protein